MSSEYGDQVFVNCPYDNEYAPFFDAIVFTIYKCNFMPRCAKELDDAGENRLDKIVRIIGECRLGIHDISRTELEPGGLPRFNVPLELGLFLGARKLGTQKHQSKKCLILDREPYRYQQFISDIAGQDVTSHNGDLRGTVIAVRDWLNTIRSGNPSGSLVWDEYRKFRRALPELCKRTNLIEDELTFIDYIRLVYGWLENEEDRQGG